MHAGRELASVVEKRLAIRHHGIASLGRDYAVEGVVRYHFDQLFGSARNRSEYREHVVAAVLARRLIA
jgi:hypothetical protein